MDKVETPFVVYPGHSPMCHQEPRPVHFVCIQAVVYTVLHRNTSFSFTHLTTYKGVCVCVPNKISLVLCRNTLF